MAFEIVTMRLAWLGFIIGFVSLLCMDFRSGLSLSDKPDLSCLENMKVIESLKGENGKIKYELYRDSSMKYSSVFYTESGKIKKVCWDVRIDTVIEFDSIRKYSLIIEKNTPGNCIDY